MIALLCAMVQGAWADSSLTTDGSGNYTIGNETDWATFCSDVNNGTESYSGKTVVLTASFAVTTKVGTVSGTTQQNAFSGTFDGGGTAKGALIGWGDSGNRTVTTCLYVMADGQNTDGLDLVKGSGTVNVSNCYKTTSAGSYGAQAYTSAPAGEISKQITARRRIYKLV